MRENINKRKTKRHQCSSPLTYQFSLFERTFNGYGMDYSGGGLSFSGNDRLSPGTIILVKHQHCSEGEIDDKTCRGCRTVSFAAVKWCQKYSKSDSYPYKIGASYLVPDDVSYF